MFFNVYVHFGCVLVSDTGDVEHDSVFYTHNGVCIDELKVDVYDNSNDTVCLKDSFTVIVNGGDQWFGQDPIDMTKSVI